MLSTAGLSDSLLLRAKLQNIKFLEFLAILKFSECPAQNSRKVYYEGTHRQYFDETGRSSASFLGRPLRRPSILACMPGMHVGEQYHGRA